MSGNITDTYAVVDKSKKTKNKNGPFPQEHSSHDPVMDLYAVVDKTKKSKPKPQSVNDMYDAVVYDSASGPTYSQLDRNQVLQSTPFQSVAKAQFSSGSLSEPAHLRKKQDPDHPKEEKVCTAPVILLVGIIILIIAVAATVVASIVAFVLIANLQSDITSMESINKSGSPSPFINSLNSLRANINDLNSKFQQAFNNLQNSINMRTSKLKDQANNLTNIQSRVHQVPVQVEIRIAEIERNLIARLMEYTPNITNRINTLMEETFNNISRARAAAQESVDELTTKIAQDIQEFHVFESCAVIGMLSLSFSSSIFLIKSSSDGPPMQVHCSTNTTILSCNGTTRRWRRVAYLNTTATTTPQCPTGLEYRSDPPSCRRSNMSAGCSSVIYPVEGSYTCIFGGIIARQSGTPDGFTAPDGSSRTNGIDENYVDGISLTFGNNPRKHIWTFAAATNGTEPTECDRCEHIPTMIVGNDYTCDVNRRCYPSLWVGGSCPPSSATFYRELLESTTEDIEMRVCRDENWNDEDFLVTLVEIYVL